ncbi:hypothetical protein ACE01N_20330 [Saccharicrinis sp. FJH2]|uniref:hypothetical protein n=1 Tax=Saccharicrinis sp. FJH65 TaxID=3344659 RepID=UPI0035F2C972
MNKELRSDILEKSLEIEYQLSKIIKEIIRVPKTDTKTLGNQSSSLTFKTKVDLIYDLDRINKDEYNLLILFMEIRNQFIHNLQADSFIETFQILGNSKKNKILNLDPEISKVFNELNVNPELNEQQEKILKIAFNVFHKKLVEIIIKQHEVLIKELKDEEGKKVKLKFHEIALDMIEIIQDTVEEFGEIYSKEIEKITGHKNDFGELLNAYVNQKSIERIKIKYPDLPD